MASKWATEKAESINLDLNIGLYRDEVDAFAAALDAARQEGAREMRERAARAAETAYRSGDVPREMDDFTGYSGFCEGIKRAAAAIRALPDVLPEEPTP